MIKRCKCLVRHAITEEERKQIWEMLRSARKTGDQNGVLLAMRQLDHCPSSFRRMQSEEAQ